MYYNDISILGYECYYAVITQLKKYYIY